MPPRKGEKGEEVSRPPTVKADDLKSMEMPDDEEGGWAGHHEEVDYTKEVVFEDSSDDESMARPSSGEGRRGRSSPRKKDKQVGVSCSILVYKKYCRVCIKHPWVGTVSALQKIGVGANVYCPHNVECSVGPPP